jgi:Viral BACON domain
MRSSAFALLSAALIVSLATPAEAAAGVLVPIVLSSGGAVGSYYTSEMTLTNRGPTTARLDFTYTAAFGGGDGTASDSLSAGQQRIVPDAIVYLRLLGVPIPDGDGRGGTLRVQVSGASDADVSVNVRTTTSVSEGRAGLAYPAISTGLTAPVYLCGLRQNAADRSNVAILNAGEPGTGDVVLRLTLYSGDSSLKTTLPDETLPPGGFKQFTEVLKGQGITNGYVKVERVSGAAPYYAYAVINDQVNSDGSFVPPVPAAANTARKTLLLPVAVESGAFTTELVLTNYSSVKKTLSFSYVADNVGTANNTATFSVALGPGTQVIIPSLVQYLRDNGVAGIGPAGTSYAGALFATVDTTDAQGIVIAGRTSAAGGGGRYGLFYSATALGEGIDGDAWIYGLRQDAENRTNLALVNTGQYTSTDVFTVELFDGTTGVLAGKVEGVSVAPKRWTQIGTILAQAAAGTSQAYARITRTAGANPYLAYAVINDGSGPGQRSGDGAFLAAERDCSAALDPADRTVGWSGGSGSFYLDISNGCSWAATSSDPWLTVTGTASGTQPALINYSAAANPGVTTRTAVLSVAGRTFPVTQIGNSAGPSDGIFTGTTFQGRPIFFQIEKNEVSSLTVGMDVTLAVCRATGTFTLTPATNRAVLSNGALSGMMLMEYPDGSRLRLNLEGTLASPKSASGRFGVSLIRTSGGTVCLTTGFGEGGSWSATKP